MDIVKKTGETCKSKNRIAYLENILLSIPNNIYWSDRNNIFLGCNLEHAKVFGLKDAKGIIGKSYYDLVPKKYATIAIKNNNAVMKYGKAKVIEELGLLSNGKEALFLSHKAPLRNGKGKIIGIIGNSVNITPVADRKIKTDYFAKLLPKLVGEPSEYLTIGEYIQAMQAYYETIIAQMPGHVYWEDKSGVILGCNNAQAQDSGLMDHKDAVGKTIFAFLPKAQALIHQSNNQLVLQTGGAQTFEETSALADGSKAIYISQKMPIKDGLGNVLGVLGVSLDITAQKLLEEQLKIAKEQAEAANKLKSEFILNMEHDLRTPAAGVKSVTEILAASEADPKRQRMLQLVHKAASELLNILTEVIKISRVDHGCFPIQATPFNLEKVIQGVINLEGVAASEKNLKVMVNYDANIPESLIGDAFRVQKILINLVSNAIKFTSQGQITIAPSLFKTSPHKVTVKIKVKDTGIGIAKDKQQFVYNKFYRIDPSNRGQYKGTGIGLYLVKKFLQDIGGKINLISHVDKGSTFTCTLPFNVE